MRLEQWQFFKAAARRQNRGGLILVSPIVDCPWIPLCCGVNQRDCFASLPH